jgi:cation diffusion facilitator CzcD-associated flavoprotein CzcO
LARENVSLVTAPIDHADAEGLVTADGDSHPFDVLIFATGFDTNSFLAPMAIEGLGGRLLEDAWKGGAEAYLGMTVPGFPNFFMMYGPNTNLGHNSIIFMLECQADYIAQCVEHLGRRGLRYLDLRPDAMRAFNERLQRDLSRTMWARTGKSWYKTADGRITNNWSGTTTRYWWETRRPDFGAYEQALADPPRAARG